MNKKQWFAVAVAGALALAASYAAAQQATPGSDLDAEMSDAGVVAPAPYDLEPRVTMSKANRSELRKLEDRHLTELRALEDRYAAELRALRAKQSAERDALLKTFAAK